MKSELLAQLQSAEAAVSAASASWFSAIAGLVLGLLTLAVAVGAAKFARDAALAARDASRHSEEGLQLAKSSVLLERRAWVYLTSLEADGMPKSSLSHTYFPVRATFRNCGSTPALSCSWRFVLLDPHSSDYSPEHALDELVRDYSIGDPVYKVGGSVLFPNDEIIVSELANVPSHLLPSFCEAPSNKWLWVIGAIFYQHILSEEVQATGVIYRIKVKNPFDEKDQSLHFKRVLDLSNVEFELQHQRIIEMP